MTRHMVSWLAAAMFAATPMREPGHAQSPPVSELQRVDFAIDSVSYQIMVPMAARLDGNARPGCVMVWHPRSNRQMTFMELCSSSLPAAHTYARQLKLTNGAILHYSIESGLGGGSGGSEAELAGQLDLNGRVLAIVCRHQSEWNPDPSWCINYLGYLKVEDR